MRTILLAFLCLRTVRSLRGNNKVCFVNQKVWTSFLRSWVGGGWVLFLFFFSIFVFNWKIIALQYCVGFCHMSTWISHRYTYVPSLWECPPTPPHPSRLWQIPGLSSPSHAGNSHWLSVFHVVMYMFPCYSLHSSPLSLPNCHVHKSVFFVCISIATLQIGSSYHLSKFHVYVLISTCFLSVTCFTLCNRL